MYRRMKSALVNRPKAIARLAGIVGPRQFYRIDRVRRQIVPRSASRKPTLIVGPGLMTIPTEGWGAIERVIDEYSNELAKSRPVSVLNSRCILLWLRAFLSRYEAIHVHYEPTFLWACRWRLISNRSTPIILWSHDAWIGQPTHWSTSFRTLWDRIARSLLRSDIFVALSPTIQEQATTRISARVVLLPNASDFRPKIRETPNRGLLVVGKVEPRKQQFEISTLVSRGIHLTCVGPIADHRVQQLISDSPTSLRAQAFVGSWSRFKLAEEMSDFRALLLPSQAEADALVLYEAQLAGLSVVCSRSALGAQDESLPWVHVFESEHDIDFIGDLCSLATTGNHLYRPTIIEHASANFRWPNRIRTLDMATNPCAQ